MPVHTAVIHFIKTRGLVSADFGASLQADIVDFLSMQNMQRHWRHHRQYYPASFQAFIDAQLPARTKSEQQKGPPV